MWLVCRVLYAALSKCVPNDATTFTLVARCPILCHPFGAATTALAAFFAVTDTAIATATVGLAATIAKFGEREYLKL